MTLIYPPVATAEYADKIGMAVERGVLRIMPHWLSREACQAEIDRHHAGRTLLPMRGLYVPTLTICTVAGDAECGHGPEPAAATALQGRRSVRVSGKPITESAGQEWNGLREHDAPAVGSRALGVPEVRHVA